MPATVSGSLGQVGDTGGSVQQGTLHSCREEPATGMGSGKGNTQEARVPRTPAHGQSSCLPNLNRAYLEGPTAGPRGQDPTQFLPTGCLSTVLLGTCCLGQSPQGS